MSIGQLWGSQKYKFRATVIQNHQFPIEIHLKYIQDSFNGITIPIAAIGHAWPLKISEHQITSFSSVSLHFESIWMHINMFVSQNHQDPTISLEAGLCTCPLTPNRN